LDQRMRALDISSVKKYIDLVRAERNSRELVHLIDAITTNVTEFFREPQHFEFLKNALRKWLIDGRRKFRFWSAACASGEEPYSMGMTALECAFGMESDLRILASDISTKALSAANRGEYDMVRMRSVPPRARSIYFNRLLNKEKAIWSVKESLRLIVDIKSINLAGPPYPIGESMDVIFCRNVMIYFDDDLRRSICNEMFRLLKPGGYLFVGLAESLSGFAVRGKMVIPSVYQKR
jgi:chemotaxis protein methyltransferase CheR